MTGKHKRIEASELSKILQLEMNDSMEILETLKDQNLVLKVKNKYQRTEESGLFFHSTAPNSSLRKIYKEMLLLAIDAIDNEPVENRSIGCESFLIDQNQLSKAKQIIEDCFNKIVRLSNQAKTKDHVYNLGIQLVKLTKGNL